jgi:hypothetical protein
MPAPHKKVRSFALSLFVLLAMLFALDASAQPDLARRDAEARFREGLSRVQANDFEGARLAFVQAYSVLKSTDVLWNLALSEMKSQHSLEAVGHFKEYVKDARTSEPERVKARKYIEELHARVGRVSVDAPAGATIVVDGVVLPTLAPLSEPVDVAPGEHFVEARLGDRSRLLRVQATGGGVAALQFRGEDLVAGGGAAASGASPMSAATPGGPDTPPNGVDPSKGPPAEPEPASDKTRWIVSGAVVGVGVAAGVTAIVFAVSSSSSRSEADGYLPHGASNACVGSAAPKECSQLDAARRAEIRDGNWAVGLGVTSAVLIAGGVATFLLWPGKPATVTATARALRVTPLVGPTNGAMLTTSF